MRGIVPLNREITLKKRLVMSSATITAVSLDVPVFDRADDMRLVRRPELEFDLVAPLRLRVLKQQIEATGARLDAFLVPKHEGAEAQD